MWHNTIKIYIITVETGVGLSQENKKATEKVIGEVLQGVKKAVSYPSHKWIKTDECLKSS